MDLKFVNKLTRAPLSEGRSYGIGFGLCKRVNDEIHVVSPISTCKDYLSDQVYSERTGKPYSIYGFSSAKQDIFTNGEAYLAVQFLPYKNGGKQDGFDRVISELVSRREQLEAFMQAIEEKLQPSNPFPLRTKIIQVSEDTLVIRMDEWWTKYCYLISLYSLVFRIAYYDNIKTSDDPVASLKGKNGDSAYLMEGAWPRLVELTKSAAPVQKMECLSPHSAGINGWWKS